MKGLKMVFCGWALAALASCGKICYCDSTELSLRYVGFPAADTDTVLFYRFRKASNFQAVDTTRLTAATASFRVTADTLAISGTDERMKLRSTYDYILYLPSVNRRDTLTGIFEVQDQVEGNSSLECDCINRLFSYQLNGASINATDPARPRLEIRR